MGEAGAETPVALSAQDCGRVCAVAGQVQRDLQRCAAGYAELFPAPPFDATFFSTVALAHAFCAPWLGAEALRLTNRITLWVFAVDRLYDHDARTRSTVDEAAWRCLAVADGAPPADDDPLTTLLAEIRDELTAAPAFAALRPAWREEMERMLRAMTREWEWKTARTGRRPTVDEYLDNAESGFSLIFVTHWIWTAGTGPIRDVPAVLAASRAVQQITALLNDLGSYGRDVQSGDLNALLLGADAEELDRRLADLVRRCRAALRPLVEGGQEPLATYLERQVAFNNGFYRVTDYQAGS